MERKRKNFGYERYNCNGTLNIHKNDNSVTFMIRHELDHQSVTRYLDEDLKNIIMEMSARSSPSQIYKELKSKYNPERIINLTLKQVTMSKNNIRYHTFGLKLIKLRDMIKHMSIFYLVVTVQNMC